MAQKYGLSALQPFDKEDGYDLNKRSVKQVADFALNKFRPLLLLIGFPCTFYCVMNENMNYQHRMEDLLELRGVQRPLLEWIVAKLRQQLREGRIAAL